MFGFDTDRVAIAALLASELVTNAVRHAHSGLTVTLDWRTSWLRVQVADDDPHPPRLTPAPGIDGGFGMRLVDSLANDWGVRTSTFGKTVWFDLDLSAANAGNGHRTFGR